MIESVIKYLNSEIECNLTYYKKLYSMTELITKDGKTFPAEYDRKEYTNVFNPDRFKSLVYYQLNGPIRISQITDEEVSINSEYLSYEYPVTLYSIVDKAVFGSKNNNEFIDNKIANNLVNLLYNKVSKTLVKELGLSNVMIEVGSYDLNRNNIWNNQFRNSDMKLDYEYSICRIDFTIVLQGSKKCFVKYGC